MKSFGALIYFYRFGYELMGLSFVCVSPWFFKWLSCEDPEMFRLCHDMAEIYVGAGF